MTEPKHQPATIDSPKNKERQVSKLKTWIALMGAAISTSGCHLAEAEGPSSEPDQTQLVVEDKEAETFPELPELVGEKYEQTYAENPKLKEAYDTILKRAERSFENLGYTEDEKKQLFGDMDYLSDPTGDTYWMVHPAMHGLFIMREGRQRYDGKQYPDKPHHLHDDAQKLLKMVSSLEFDREKIELGSKVLFEDCEQFGVSKEIMNSVVKETWPDLCRRNVYRIRYEDDTKELSYTPSGTAFADCTRFRGVKEQVTVYSGAKDTVPSYTVSILDHEAAHAIDFVARENMRLIDRVHMMREVMERVRSADRFKSSYVESIDVDNEWKELLHKVDEYWAEIYQEFMKDPESFEKDYPKDYSLIKKYVLDLEPSFDPQKAAEKRKELVGDLDREYVSKNLIIKITKLRLILPKGVKIEEFVKLITIEMRYFKQSLRDTEKSTDIKLAEVNRIRTKFEYENTKELVGEEFSRANDAFTDAGNLVVRVYNQNPQALLSQLGPEDEEKILKKMQSKNN